ncbi:MAG: hypothetical protein ACYC3W_12620, partial [Candidatus Nanopelagicales bacterium]
AATATLAAGWYQVLTTATIDTVEYAVGQMVYSDGTASLTVGSVKNLQTACLFVYGYSNNGYAILVGKAQLTYSASASNDTNIPAGWYRADLPSDVDGVSYLTGEIIYLSAAGVLNQGSGVITRYTPSPLRSNATVGTNRTGTVMQCSFAPSQTIYYEVHDVEKLKDLYNLLLMIKMPTDVYDGV